MSVRLLDRDSPVPAATGTTNPGLFRAAQTLARARIVRSSVSARRSATAKSQNRTWLPLKFRHDNRVHVTTHLPSLIHCSAPALKALLASVVAERGTKLGNVAQPVRVAITRDFPFTRRQAGIAPGRATRFKRKRPILPLLAPIRLTSRHAETPIGPLPPSEPRSCGVSAQHQPLPPPIASLRPVAASATLHQRRRHTGVAAAASPCYAPCMLSNGARPSPFTGGSLTNTVKPL